MDPSLSANILQAVFESAGHRAGVKVSSEELRKRLTIPQGLWQTATAELRRTGQLCHDGEERFVSLTRVGAARAQLKPVQGAA